jgi:hypothetical protein
VGGVWPILAPHISETVWAQFNIQTCRRHHHDNPLNIIPKLHLSLEILMDVKDISFEFDAFCIKLKINRLFGKQGSTWPWSYGSWIYNYLYNQCLSPLTLWVRIPLRRDVLDTTLCDQFVSDLRQVCGFLRVLRFPPQ